MTALDDKINEHFSGLVVRKDLVKIVKGNAIVPSYVLEFLLGQYCATADEESIKTGIETVKEILRKHYVHRNEAGLIKSVIREKGRHKVIDKVSVALNDKKDVYEASFANLGVKQILVDADTVKKHPKLLVSGVWSIVDMEYEHFEDKSVSPWIINKLKPIQLSSFDYEKYIDARRQFTTDEWIDLLIQSIGFNPEKLGKRSKLLQLVRLIPFCERNYNLIELGPKGTGKSHIFSDFSPHGILISGGEITVPKLFVNNSSGKIGLVGYWDTVAFDEFAGKEKRIQQALVDIMKNYMANKSFSRGVETIGAEASMVFVGNTRHNLPYMLKHTDLFDELPKQYYDSAFLDRIHFYLPGWEVDIIRGELFSEGYGFVVDYLAEILRFLRNHDHSGHYSQYFDLVSDISTRDKDGINKTFSGLMKILYPHQEATEQEIEDVLQFAIEGRKRVKDQLMKIDSTYAAVRFAYTKNDDETTVHVKSLEEEEYPQYFGSVEDQEPESETGGQAPEQSQEPAVVSDKPPELKKRQVIVKENQRGVTFDKLFSDYLQDAGKITVTDSYIRIYYQIRNFMEFIETIVRIKPKDDEVDVHLITVQDDFKGPQQIDSFIKIQENCAIAGVHFTWEFDETKTLHARHIVTDHGWKILLDRGLDIFQHYEINDSFSLSNRLQQYRSCKAFEITYLKTKG
ncbi:BREX system Lon protease-like protein BrxL [Desulfobacter latus]|uniref:BREX system Lon protease-like protein BrxL n=1 Tax=Desulfobacter latus TaxID=2292 RepID=A0A850T5P9_9BACT|nr:BREX system Lon protease-like protein BrxL [Desulfobacter latus]NWH03638.1 BREX system Lon protease-like protein BrxL [Desulfobacter latus]